MDPIDDRPFIKRYPFETMVVAALVLALLGILLVFTVVGSIIGLPLLAIAGLLGFLAWHKFRRDATRA